jgi:hypothetical protein
MSFHNALYRHAAIEPLENRAYLFTVIRRNCDMLAWALADFSSYSQYGRDERTRERTDQGGRSPADL